MGKTTSLILTTKQKKFLHLVGTEKSLAQRFYLTGGTALTAFYLHHRYSEDIDLFSEEEFNIAPIRAFVKKAERTIGAENVDYQNFMGLHTFFFLFRNSREKLKVDFNYYPFGRIEHGLVKDGVTIDSVYDIAVNKIHTIAMKPRARDFIDIYYILKQYPYTFHDLLLQAKAKFDWHIDFPQLGAQLLRAIDVKDFPRMLQPMNNDEWQEFFVREAKKLEKDIFM